MDIREQVIREYLAGGTSYQKLQEKYKISRTVICKWVLVHQAVHNLPPSKNQHTYTADGMKRTSKKDASKDPSVTALQEQIRTLQKQLELEKLRSEALDTMIDIAEEQLNISIRKKSAAQQ